MEIVQLSKERGHYSYDTIQALREWADDMESGAIPIPELLVIVSQNEDETRVFSTGKEAPAKRGTVFYLLHQAANYIMGA